VHGGVYPGELLSRQYHSCKSMKANVMQTAASLISVLELRRQLLAYVHDIVYRRSDQQIICIRMVATKRTGPRARSVLLPNRIVWFNR
jgi:hypothetical protein